MPIGVGPATESVGTFLTKLRTDFRPKLEHAKDRVTLRYKNPQTGQINKKRLLKDGGIFAGVLVGFSIIKNFLKNLLGFGSPQQPPMQ